MSRPIESEIFFGPCLSYLYFLTILMLYLKPIRKN